MDWRIKQRYQPGETSNLSVSSTEEKLKVKQEVDPLNLQEYDYQQLEIDLEDEPEHYFDEAVESVQIKDERSDSD